jgi:diaminopimelate decarboxylase
LTDVTINPDGVAGVSWQTIARDHGTPVYVYDAEAMRSAFAHMRAALTYEPSRVYYSVKANSALAVIDVLRGAGAGLDVCSPADLYAATLVGARREEITYAAFGASDDELRMATAEAGTVVLDSLEELERVAELDLTDRVGVRINPGIRAGFHGHVVSGDAEAKFGVAIADLERFWDVARDRGILVEGLHAHLGSDIRQASAHAELLRVLSVIAATRPSIRWIDIGGGFGTPRRAYEPRFDWGVVDREAHRSLRMADGRELELRLEPGAHVTMGAGYLLARVTDVQRGSGVRPDTLIVDANTNHLVSVLLYQAHHEVALAGAERRADPRTYRIAGNLMQAADVLVDAIELPGDAGRTDLLVFGQAGAYAATRASAFNGRPRPAEVMVDGGVATTIREAETVADLFVRDRRAAPLGD